MNSLRKKLLAIVLAVMVGMTFSIPAFAEDDAAKADGEKAAAAEEQETEPAKEEPKEEETAQEETKETEPAQTESTESEEPSGSSESVSEESSSEEESQSEEKSGSEDSDKKSSSKKGASSGNATYEEVNNATDLPDGDYEPADFSFTGGTGKTKLSCDKIIVKGGSAKAVIRISSTKFTHIFTGKVDTAKNGDDENTDLYDTETGKIGTGVYKMTEDGSGVIATIPVALGTAMNLAGRTTAMSEAHWIQYSITVSASEENRTGDASIADGTYKPDSFTFEGGTGKATMTCEKVIVSGGKATAVMKASSDKMTHIYMGKATSNNETPSLYDPDTNKRGADVYPFADQQVSVPVVLNQDADCAVRTTAMSSPHWVNYTYHLELTADSEKISDSTEIPENADPYGQGQETDPTDPSKEDPGQEEKPDASESKKLTAGTWKVKATTDRKMFYLYPKDTDPAWTILKVKSDKSMTATITLTGDGYDYVYMGTPAQAKKAGKSGWIKGKVVNGYYTFTIPVSKLDKKLAITPHSKKYESDGDPKTDPWRPDKWIIFYSKDAKKTSDDASIKTGKKKTDDSGKTSGTQTKFQNDKKADKVSKWKDDSGKSTSAVNNSTSLKDGVYSPDRFSWSGGSGRLAYIRCDKITVSGGKAYATIEFGSSKYDSLKANGRVYSKQGGGNSKFVIPVKLNANNTIIGRTTAMSQPHWVRYSIFVYKAGATAGTKAGAAGTDGHVTNTRKLSDKAPDLLGLKQKGAAKVKNAKYFRIFYYENDITLVSIDQGTGTALEKKAGKNEKDQDKTGDTKGSGTSAAADNAKAGQTEETIADKAMKTEPTTVAEEADAAGATAEELAQAEAEVGGTDGAENAADTGSADNQAKIEYDEEGKPIAKTGSELTNDLYKNNVVNYLIVPKDAEIPAGLEKDCVIIQRPVGDAYIASEEALDTIVSLDQLKNISNIGLDAEAIDNSKAAAAVKKDKVGALGSYEEPDYKALVQSKTDLAVIPGQALPAKVTKKSSDEEKAVSAEKAATLKKLQTRYSSLEVPLIVDRCEDEANNWAKAEWAMVYGAIFGEEKDAEQMVTNYISKNKKEKISHE